MASHGEEQPGAGLHLGYSAPHERQVERLEGGRKKKGGARGSVKMKKGRWNEGGREAKEKRNERDGRKV